MIRSNCKRAQIIELKESLYLQSEGTRIRALSPLRSLDKSRHIVPTALLVRVQGSRKDLDKAVEGPSIRHI